jgi:hypothetical protein
MISTIVKAMRRCGDAATKAGTTSAALGTLLAFVFFGSGARRGEPVPALGRRSAGALP